MLNTTKSVITGNHDAMNNNSDLQINSVSHEKIH